MHKIFREGCEHLGQKFNGFFEQWKYLLFQEKCRLCERMIHPLIKGMNFEFYAPPAKYFIDRREIISDVLCQSCIVHLTTCQPFVNQHPYKIYGGIREERQDFYIASGAMFKEPINTLIHRLKYSNDVLLAKDLNILLLRAWLLASDRLTKCEKLDELCLVPVPLHRRRLNERGYNQSQFLSQHIGKVLKIPIETKLLKRVKDTKSQQELSKTERAENVSQAFKCKSNEAFAGKIVILIDDVCTSGATLSECANAVMQGGAKQVLGLTVAFVP